MQTYDLKFIHAADGVKPKPMIVLRVQADPDFVYGIVESLSWALQQGISGHVSGYAEEAGEPLPNDTEPQAAAQ